MVVKLNYLTACSSGGMGSGEEIAFHVMKVEATR